jgi:hypothetical protein
MSDNPLKDQRVDKLVAVANGVVGGVPIVGAMAAEALTEFIPEQKLDRLELWLNLFAERVEQLEHGLERLRLRISTPEGADIFEDGAVQASRSVTNDRRRHLANIIANGLARPKCRARPNENARAPLFAADRFRVDPIDLPLPTSNDGSAMASRISGTLP